MPFLSNVDSVVSFTQVFLCLFISIHFKMLPNFTFHFFSGSGIVSKHISSF